MMSSPRTANSDFASSLAQKVQIVNETLDRILADQREIPDDLKKALVYTLAAPGKRIRSALVLWCCELVAGQENANARTAAAALEMVHTYSLVHDDLPAMDNDDLRRGRPTCHKAFDEATAILAGDGLLTLAFEVLADRIDGDDLAIRLIRQLAQAAGPAGMIAGQMADLRAENMAGSIEVLEYIHTNKTAKMFRCAAVMGALCGGAERGQSEALSQYGLKIGLGFQIADDILDVSASSEQLGKTAGKDVTAAKCTYPAVVGIEKARELEHKLAREAVAVLEPFGRKADVLRQLVTALLNRNR
jgi:geranylgeranyl diphosphate synthase type II